MKRANCDCGVDHVAEYKAAAVKLSKRHKMFTVFLLFSATVALAGAVAFDLYFGCMVMGLYGIYFAYVNLAAIDHGRTHVAGTLDQLAREGDKPPASEEGGNYL